MVGLALQLKGGTQSKQRSLCRDKEGHLAFREIPQLRVEKIIQNYLSVLKGNY